MEYLRWNFLRKRFSPISRQYFCEMFQTDARLVPKDASNKNFLCFVSEDFVS